MTTILTVLFDLTIPYFFTMVLFYLEFYAHGIPVSNPSLSANPTISGNDSITSSRKTTIVTKKDKKLRNIYFL